MSVDSGPALVEKINKVLPITPSACWSLHGVEKDFSVWQCHDTGLTADGSVHACCAVVRSSVESVLQTLVDHSQRVNWDCTVSNVKTVAMSTGPCMSQHSGRNDVVAVTPRVWTRWSLLRSPDASISMARWWQCHKRNEWAWMLWRSLDEEETDMMWMYALVSQYPIPDHCALVIVVGSSVTTIPQPATAQQMLTGLHQYLTVLQISQHIVVPASEFRLEKSGTDDEEATPAIERTKSQSSASSSVGHATPRSEGSGLSPTGLVSVISSDSLRDSKGSSGYDTDSLTDQQQRFAGVLGAACSSVQRAIEEDASDGWEPVVTRGGLDVMKKSLGLSISCTRCSIIIDAPAEVILECFEDNSRLMEWDEMISESRTVEYVTESMWVEHWTHKPVWPATSRDFCVVAGHARRENGAGWVSAARSVVHPACPVQPAHVRGHVLECGAVIRPVGDSLEKCLVSYITHFDFKGNVSAVVAHRIGQCVPTCMQLLQRLCMKTHKQMQEDLRKQRQSAAELAASALVSPLRAPDDSRNGGIAAHPPTDVSDGAAADGASAAIVDGAQEEGEDPESVLASLALEYPMVDQSHVDYRTLGNQAAAGFLGELLQASDIDVYQPRDSGPSGGWRFDGIEKDVVILRKEIQAIGHSLFMGKGIIPLPLSRVWKALREPHTRFGYDPMLKEMKTIAKYGERLMIMYMLLEARHCLLAQARDFCFLHHERVEGQKHIIAAQSVDHPKCPCNPDIQRGQIYSSGWCVEPAEQDGKDYSMVTYLGRIDLKGSVPRRLTNFICRRQTLAIHSLSRYLLTSNSG
ncbi:uncharacterized protein LOC135815153 isoform X2 [Sycon ciliatum]|uniref:uncharacterized protein LOC135815153 isoform X2 n=1 Tax=Sycon ciliatum TaxID=27933 RepID=UPI0031F714C6